MIELKTLKDLIFDLGIFPANFTNFIDPKELKAEAVKWFRQLKRFSFEESYIAFLGFFNLTEEDLK